MTAKSSQKWTMPFIFLSRTALGRCVIYSSASDDTDGEDFTLQMAVTLLPKMINVVVGNVDDAGEEYDDDDKDADDDDDGEAKQMTVVMFIIHKGRDHATMIVVTWGR